MEQLLEIKELILNVIEHPISEEEKKENLNSALRILDQLIESEGTMDDYKQETSEMLIDYLLKKESAE